MFRSFSDFLERAAWKQPTELPSLIASPDALPQRFVVLCCPRPCLRLPSLLRPLRPYLPGPGQQIRSLLPVDRVLYGDVFVHDPIVRRASWIASEPRFSSFRLRSAGTGLSPARCRPQPALPPLFRRPQATAAQRPPSTALPRAAARPPGLRSQSRSPWNHGAVQTGLEYEQGRSSSVAGAG